MRKTVSIAIPHRLGREEAKRRLRDGFAKAHREVFGRAVNIEQNWSGDHMDFKAAIMGQSVDGRLDVGEESVLIEADLPWLLASIAERFGGRLKKETTLLLEKK